MTKTNEGVLPRSGTRIHLPPGAPEPRRGDIAGREKITNPPSPAILQQALQPLQQAILAASDENHQVAEAKFAALKGEFSKGEEADYATVADLLVDLAQLAPGVPGATATAFGNPALGTIVRPTIQSLLSKLRALRSKLRGE